MSKIIVYNGRCYFHIEFMRPNRLQNQMEYSLLSPTNLYRSPIVTPTTYTLSLTHIYTPKDLKPKNLKKERK